MVNEVKSTVSVCSVYKDCSPKIFGILVDTCTTGAIGNPHDPGTGLRRELLIPADSQSQAVGPESQGLQLIKEPYPKVLLSWGVGLFFLSRTCVWVRVGVEGRKERWNTCHACTVLVCSSSNVCTVHSCNVLVYHVWLWTQQRRSPTDFLATKSELSDLQCAIIMGCPISGPCICAASIISTTQRWCDHKVETWLCNTSARKHTQWTRKLTAS